MSQGRRAVAPYAFCPQLRSCFRPRSLPVTPAIAPDVLRCGQHTRWRWRWGWRGSGSRSRGSHLHCTMRLIDAHFEKTDISFASFGPCGQFLPRPAGSWQFAAIAVFGEAKDRLTSEPSFGTLRVGHAVDDARHCKVKRWNRIHRTKGKRKAVLRKASQAQAGSFRSVDLDLSRLEAGICTSRCMSRLRAVSTMHGPSLITRVSRGGQSIQVSEKYLRLLSDQRLNSLLVDRG